MVDPISNATRSRQSGPTQNRSQASSGSAGFEAAQAGLAAVQRVEALRAAAEKLIKKNPSRYSRFPLLSDEEGGASLSDAEDSQRGSDPQWPPAQLLKLHHYLKQMEGLLVDTEA
jgi:hypothetical protein